MPGFCTEWNSYFLLRSFLDFFKRAIFDPLTQRVLCYYFEGNNISLNSFYVLKISSLSLALRGPKLSSFRPLYTFGTWDWWLSFHLIVRCRCPVTCSTDSSSCWWVEAHSCQIYCTFKENLKTFSDWSDLTCSWGGRHSWQISWRKICMRCRLGPHKSNTWVQVSYKWRS